MAPRTKAMAMLDRMRFAKEILKHWGNGDHGLIEQLYEVEAIVCDMHAILEEMVDRERNQGRFMLIHKAPEINQKAVRRWHTLGE